MKISGLKLEKIFLVFWTVVTRSPVVWWHWFVPAGETGPTRVRRKTVLGVGTTHTRTDRDTCRLKGCRPYYGPYRQGMKEPNVHSHLCPPERIRTVVSVQEQVPGPGPDSPSSPEPVPCVFCVTNFTTFCLGYSIQNSLTYKRTFFSPISYWVNRRNSYAPLILLSLWSTRGGGLGDLLYTHRTPSSERRLGIPWSDS